METVQSDPDLCAFYSTYQDARRRLADRVRTRGFWPACKGSGKPGNKGGKGKGKGKSLAQRVANSDCRYCGRKGHCQTG